MIIAQIPQSNNLKFWLPWVIGTTIPIPCQFWEDQGYKSEYYLVYLVVGKKDS